jgi:uncharacterized protein involved in exopolysaccharide biosynthesis
MQHVERPDRSIIEVVYRRRWVAIATLAIALIAVIALSIVVKPKYGGIAHVLLVNDATGRDPESASFDMPTIATSTSVVEDVKRKLNLPYTIAELQKAIVAHVAPKSSILTISYRSKSPAEAVAVPNAVADSFAAYYSAIPRTRVNAVIDAFQKELADKRASLTILEKRLEAQSQGKSYVGSQTSLDNIANQLTLLREQRGAAYSQLAQDRAELAADRGEPAKTAKIVRHEILMYSPAYKDLELNVAHDRSAYATFRASVSDQYPGLAGFKDKVQKEDQVLAKARVAALNGPDAYSPSLGGQIVATDKMSAAVVGDQARVEALDAQISSAQSELEASSIGNSSSLGALRALRDSAEAQYEALAARFSTAQANAADSNSLGQAVVVDRAVVAEPNIVGPTLILILGSIVAFGLAVGAAYLAEMIDPRLLSPADAEAFYGRPTLASLNTK